jgi:hypothetical protein
MGEPLDVEQDLADVVTALERATAFLNRHDVAHATLMGLAPGWQSPVSLALQEGRRAAGRLARALPVTTRNRPEPESIDGFVARRSLPGDPGD